MNAVLATQKQSATLNAISTPIDWQEYDYQQSARRAAKRSAKGVVKESQMLKRENLLNMVRADIRSHFPALYAVKGRLPEAVNAQVEKAVDGFLAEKLGTVNVENVISMKRYHYFNKALGAVTERTQLVAENIVSAREQRFGLIVMIGKATKRLNSLLEKPAHDEEHKAKVTSARESLLNFQLTLERVDSVLAELNAKEEEEVKAKAEARAEKERKAKAPKATKPKAKAKATKPAKPADVVPPVPPVEPSK